jgi:hypothetical protein
MWKTILITIATGILKDAAHVLWDTLWGIVGAAMIEAEKQWKLAGSGTVKKEFVMKNAMEFINKNFKLNFITRWVVQTFVGNVVDRLIQELNTDFDDHKWVEHVKDIRDYIEKYLPGFLK